jgi:hypothetical protein
MRRIFTFDPPDSPLTEYKGDEFGKFGPPDSPYWVIEAVGGWARYIAPLRPDYFETLNMVSLRVFS